ncbi:MAG: hypothetical protein A2W19_07325 [Spirochaetes bacterium RBG_16_49_21]|nr:MAG: hypothetical protein A2W19_07325 [Spirochaetes bacterium RBG_16_49_21]
MTDIIRKIHVADERLGMIESIGACLVAGNQTVTNDQVSSIGALIQELAEGVRDLLESKIDE